VPGLQNVRLLGVRELNMNIYVGEAIVAVLKFACFVAAVIVALKLWFWILVE